MNIEYMTNKEILNEVITGESTRNMDDTIGVAMTVYYLFNNYKSETLNYIDNLTQGLAFYCYGYNGNKQQEFINHIDEMFGIDVF